MLIDEKHNQVYRTIGIHTGFHNNTNVATFFNKTIVERYILPASEELEKKALSYMLETDIEIVPTLNEFLDSAK